MRFATGLTLALALIGAGGPSAVSASPLILTCHELIQGAPDPDGNRFVLENDVLTNRVFGQNVFLSSSKLRPLDGGAGAWAVHKVLGHKVRRTVFSKDRMGKMVPTMSEVYDFDAQTVRGGRRGQDSCHHSGR